MTWYGFQICIYDCVWLDMVSKYINMTEYELDMISKYVNIIEYDLIWFPNMLIW